LAKKSKKICIPGTTSQAPDPFSFLCEYDIKLKLFENSWVKPGREVQLAPGHFTGTCWYLTANINYHMARVQKDPLQCTVFPTFSADGAGGEHTRISIHSATDTTKGNILLIK
jgi:hypothetical protein